MRSSTFPDDNTGFLRKPSATTLDFLAWLMLSNQSASSEVIPQTGHLLPESEQKFNDSGEPYAMACTDASFDDACERYYDSLYRFVVPRIGDVQYAEEVVQDTLLAASKHWSELKNVHEMQLWKWLLTTAKNKIKDHFRHEQRRPPHWSSYQEVIALVPYVSDNDLETNDVLWQTLGQLPERERECILYVYQDGYSIDEVAHELKVGASSVRSYLTRGRKRFQQIYNKLQNDFTDGRSKK
jgi:RNA polymerase sigma-70 factor, ECF subfamily